MPNSPPSAMRIFYLVHDLDDPAIERRQRQLTRGGAKVKLAGFGRDGEMPAVFGRANFCRRLGRRHNGRLGRRLFSILWAAIRLPTWAGLAQDSDIIIARNLEMLALGALLQVAFNRRQILVYESLDIHRLMVSRSMIGFGLRRLERHLMRRCSLLITSSPAFIEGYFQPYHHIIPPTFLWENKMLTADIDQNLPIALRTPESPWKIGWFGIIRCERSLRVLESVCRALPGIVEVHIRGRPTAALKERIAAAAVTTPGVIFGGAYDRSRDLPDLYGQVHFSWAIDYFEEGANSEWLLPNRLYEGAGHGAIPLALRDVETGRWMVRSGFGVVLGSDIEDELIHFFSSLCRETYQALQAELSAVDREAFMQSDEELISIIRRLDQLPQRSASLEAVLS